MLKNLGIVGALALATGASFAAGVPVEGSSEADRELVVAVANVSPLNPSPLTARQVRDSFAAQPLGSMSAALGYPSKRQCIQRAAEFAITPRRHRQDELQLALGIGRQRAEFGDVVEA